MTYTEFKLIPSSHTGWFLLCMSVFLPALFTSTINVAANYYEMQEVPSKTNRCYNPKLYVDRVYLYSSKVHYPCFKRITSITKHSFKDTVQTSVSFGNIMNYSTSCHP